jgi:hypothetical protein
VTPGYRRRASRASALSDPTTFGGRLCSEYAGTQSTSVGRSVLADLDCGTRGRETEPGVEAVRVGGHRHPSASSEATSHSSSTCTFSAWTAFSWASSSAAFA